MPISLHDIKNIAKKLSIGIIKELTHNVILGIIHIYNSLLSTELFPEPFKQAIIKYISKNQNGPKFVLNYSPISLLEAIGKIYENIRSKN